MKKVIFQTVKNYTSKEIKKRKKRQNKKFRSFEQKQKNSEKCIL